MKIVTVNPDETCDECVAKNSVLVQLGQDVEPYTVLLCYSCLYKALLLVVDQMFKNPGLKVTGPFDKDTTNSV